jgi:guanylate kinase
VTPGGQKVVIITAPSGAGKTTITRFLLNRFQGRLSFSVSATNRPPRDGEKDGSDYHFIDTERFRELIREDAFLEWEMVYEGRYYGTLRSEVDRIWNVGQAALLDIDVKGALSVMQRLRGSTLSLFIEPPSLEELARRLSMRGTETEQSLRTRIEKAAYEISFKDSFDRRVVNDDLERACEEVAGIVGAFLNVD